MAEITMQDLLSKEVSKLLDQRMAGNESLEDLKGKDSLKFDELQRAVATTWLRNGMTINKDAQDFVDNPDLRKDYRISLPELCRFIDDSVKKVESDEDFQDNVGLPTNAGILIPRIITQIVREAIEPVLVGTSLLRRISYGYGEHISFPAAGAFTATDIGPTQEYPERSLEFAGEVTAKVKKSGIKIRIPEEMIRYSAFDVMSLHMRAAGRAMARHKEQKIFNLINDQGTAVFDNTGGSSTRGLTSGRARNATGNYTLTLDDLFSMYADLLNAGFTPDTLIMNPMGWLVFVLNSTLRHFGFVNGGRLWGTWSGQPAMAPKLPDILGAPAGNTPSTTPTEMPNSNLQGNVPTLFPAPLAIVVSPFMEFDNTNQTTTISMCDRNELGYYIEDEPLVTETFDEPSRDISATKFRERYALAIDHGGDSIVNALGVKIAKGHDFEDFTPIHETGSGDLPDITGTV